MKNVKMRQVLAALLVAIGLPAAQGCGPSTADTGVLVKVWLDESMLRPGDKVGVVYRTVDLHGDNVSYGEVKQAMDATPVENLYNPLVLAFVPADGREDQAVQIAAGLVRDRTTYLLQQYVVVYEKGAWHELEMDLMSSCVDVGCDDGETCSYGSCEPILVMGSDLPVPSEQDAP